MVEVMIGSHVVGSHAWIVLFFWEGWGVALLRTLWSKLLLI
jgi:hypothetical protein